VLPSGLASSSDSCRVTLDREREEQFCGLLMFHTHSHHSPDFPSTRLHSKEFQNDDLSQLRNALRHLTRGFLGCLAAEEVGDTWRFTTRPRPSQVMRGSVRVKMARPTWSGASWLPWRSAFYIFTSCHYQVLAAFVWFK